MIIFTNSSGETVLSIESEQERKVSLMLKFSADTIRFLQSDMDLTIGAQDMTSMYQKYAKLIVEGQTNISEEEMKKVVEMGKSAVMAQKSKATLTLDLMSLLGINDLFEQGALTIQDANKIYNLVKTDPANNFPLA